MKRICSIALIFFTCGKLFSGEPAITYFTASDYISTYRSKAISEMLTHGIPASIIMAQGMIESGNGNSNLARNAKNHFGIKCHKEWSGPTYTMDDDEKDECFRKYDNVLDSYTDHSYFLVTRPRYCFLFQLPKTDYIGWARGLKTAGYATHPQYAEKLIGVIEANHLYDLDTITNFVEETIQFAKVEKKKTNYLSKSTETLLEQINKYKIYESINNVIAEVACEKAQIKESEITFSKPLTYYDSLFGLKIEETALTTEITPQSITLETETVLSKPLTYYDSLFDLNFIKEPLIVMTAIEKVAEKNNVVSIVRTEKKVDNLLSKIKTSGQNLKENALTDLMTFTELKKTTGTCKNFMLTESTFELNKKPTPIVQQYFIPEVNYFNENPFMKQVGSPEDDHSVILLQEALDFLSTSLFYN